MECQILDFYQCVCVCNMRKVHSLTPINEVRRGFLWCVTDGTHRIHTTTTNIGSNEKWWIISYLMERERERERKSTYLKTRAMSHSALSITKIKSIFCAATLLMITPSDKYKMPSCSFSKLWTDTQRGRSSRFILQQSNYVCFVEKKRKL